MGSLGVAAMPKESVDDQIIVIIDTFLAGLGPRDNISSIEVIDFCLDLRLAISPN